MGLYSIQISNKVLYIILAMAPIVVTFLGNVSQISDYVLCGIFLQSVRLQSAPQDTFDFIIVGAGSAGSTVAARLSENPSVKILLLEAGGNPNPLSYIPLAVTLGLNNPATDWAYKTVRQNGSALAAINNLISDFTYLALKRKFFWPRGKSLGGSSNLNFLIYNKGNSQDFDRWAEHTGDYRWAYKNLSNYFKKIEDYVGTWDGSGLHGKGGPMRIESAGYAPGLKYILNAAKDLGYEIRDNNGNQGQGFSPFDLTSKRGLRYSTFWGYLWPAKRRKNLVIYRYAIATKIYFDKTLRAVGVSFLRHGLKGYARATKEVIVCGGSINSPQLLMLSGIGRKSHLDKIGIKTLVDLPVGDGLQDHVTTLGGPFLIDKPLSLMIDRDINLLAITDYLLQGVGPLSSPLALAAVGFTSTVHTTSSWPNIMYSIISLGLAPQVPAALDGILNTGTHMRTYLSAYIGKDSHLAAVTLGLPKSRGIIRLRNRNPLSKPLIDPRYFSDPEGQDIAAIVQGVKEIVRLYENTTTFRESNARLVPKHVPGCERHEFKSDKYFECSVRVVTTTLYHPTSTCRMGKVDDPSAVVDSRLMVLGTKALRVADASIMPYITNANTNAPSIVIGEMVSDFIKSSWKL